MRARAEGMGVFQEIEGHLGFLGKGLIAATAAAAAFSASVIAIGGKALQTTTDMGHQAYEMGKMFGISGNAASQWVAVGQAVGVSGDQMSASFRILSRNLETVTRGLQANPGQAAAVQMATERLTLAQQRYNDAVGKYGANSTQAQSAMIAMQGAQSNLNKAMESGAKIPPAIAQALSVLGVSAVDAQGHVKPLQQLMLDIADGFHNLPPSVNQAGLAMALFGRSGAALLPVLDEGSAGIAGIIKQATAEGDVMSNTAVDADQKYFLVHQQIKEVMQGLYLTIGSALLPMMTSLGNWIIGPGGAMLRNLLSTVLGWATQAAPAVAHFFGDFIAWVRGPFWSAVTNVADWFHSYLLMPLDAIANFVRGPFLTALGGIWVTLQHDLFPRLVDFGGALFINVIDPLVHLATVVIPPVINGFNGVLQALGKVVDWVRINVLPQFQQIVNWLQSSPIQNAFQGIADAVGAVLPKLAAFGTAVWTGLIQPLIAFVQQHAPAILGVVKGIVSAFGSFVAWVKTNLLPTIEQIGSWFASKVWPQLQKIADAIVNNLLPALADIGKWIKNNVIDPLIKVAEAIIPPFLAAFGWIIEHAKTILPILAEIGGAIAALWAVDKIAGWVNAVKNAFSAVALAQGGLLGKAFPNLFGGGASGGGVGLPGNLPLGGVMEVATMNVVEMNVANMVGGGGGALSGLGNLPSPNLSGGGLGFGPNGERIPLPPPLLPPLLPTGPPGWPAEQIPVPPVLLPPPTPSFWSRLGGMAKTGLGYGGLAVGTAGAGYLGGQIAGQITQGTGQARGGILDVLSQVGGGTLAGGGAGALIGTMGGPFAPISVPVGTAVGAAGGLLSSLWGATHPAPAGGGAMGNLQGTMKDEGDAAIADLNAFQQAISSWHGSATITRDQLHAMQQAVTDGAVKSDSDLQGFGLLLDKMPGDAATAEKGAKGLGDILSSVQFSTGAQKDQFVGAYAAMVRSGNNTKGYQASLELLIQSTDSNVGAAALAYQGAWNDLGVSGNSAKIAMQNQAQLLNAGVLEAGTGQQLYLDALKDTALTANGWLPDVHDIKAALDTGALQTQDDFAHWSIATGDLVTHGVDSVVASQTIAALIGLGALHTSQDMESFNSQMDILAQHGFDTQQAALDLGLAIKGGLPPTQQNIAYFLTQLDQLGQKTHGILPPMELIGAAAQAGALKTPGLVNNFDQSWADLVAKGIVSKDNMANIQHWLQTGATTNPGQIKSFLDGWAKSLGLVINPNESIETELQRILSALATANIPADVNSLDHYLTLADNDAANLHAALSGALSRIPNAGTPYQGGGYTAYQEGGISLMPDGGGFAVLHGKEWIVPAHKASPWLQTAMTAAIAGHDLGSSFVGGADETGAWSPGLNPDENFGSWASGAAPGRAISAIVQQQAPPDNEEIIEWLERILKVLEGMAGKPAVSAALAAIRVGAA